MDTPRVISPMREGTGATGILWYKASPEEVLRRRLPPPDGALPRTLWQWRSGLLI